jgi:cytochrome c oxidase subunit II
VNRAFQITSLFVLSVFVSSSGSAIPTNSAPSQQNRQVIEVTARKYEYSPSPIRVKAGAPVQLNFTSLDKTHGFKINLYPDGADPKGEPGLVFSSSEDCFKLEKGIPTLVQFIPRTPGTYSFHCCNRCGLGHSGMKGQLIVEP